MKKRFLKPLAARRDLHNSIASGNHAIEYQQRRGKMLRMAGIDGEFRFDKLMEDIGGQFFQNNRPDTAALGFVMTMGGAGIAQGAKKVNFGDRKKTICK